MTEAYSRSILTTKKKNADFHTHDGLFSFFSSIIGSQLSKKQSFNDKYRKMPKYNGTHIHKSSEEQKKEKKIVIVGKITPYSILVFQLYIEKTSFQ
jgi:hypothetical protein